MVRFAGVVVVNGGGEELNELPGSVVALLSDQGGDVISVVDRDTALTSSWGTAVTRALFIPVYPVCVQSGRAPQGHRTRRLILLCCLPSFR